MQKNVLTILYNSIDYMLNSKENLPIQVIRTFQSYLFGMKVKYSDIENGTDVKKYANTYKVLCCQLVHSLERFIRQKNL